MATVQITWFKKLHLMQINVNVKVHPATGHKGPEGEQRYSSALSLTSALDGGGWSTLRLGSFTPEKETRYPFCRRLGGPQGRSGRVRSLVPEEFVLPEYVATWVYNQIQTFRDKVVTLSLGFGQSFWASDYPVQQLSAPEKWNPQCRTIGITAWFIQIHLLVSRKWNHRDYDLTERKG